MPTTAWPRSGRAPPQSPPSPTTAGGGGSRKSPGGVTHTYISDQSNLIEERVSTGQTRRYVEGRWIDQHLAAEDGATVKYYLAGYLNSIAHETNAAGEPTLSRGYDPWGDPLSAATSAGWAYAGREWDPETGLYYYKARYYAPQAGRFISEDPTVSETGVGKPSLPLEARMELEPPAMVLSEYLPNPRERDNLYRSFVNDPVNKFDPNGLAGLGNWDKARRWMQRQAKRLKCESERQRCMKKIAVYCCDKYPQGKNDPMYGPFLNCKSMYYLGCCGPRMAKCMWLPFEEEEEARRYTEDCPPDFPQPKDY